MWGIAIGELRPRNAEREADACYQTGIEMGETYQKYRIAGDRKEMWRAFHKIYDYDDCRNIEFVEGVEAGCRCDFW